MMSVRTRVEKRWIKVSARNTYNLVSNTIQYATSHSTPHEAHTTSAANTHEMETKRSARVVMQMNWIESE